MMTRKKKRTILIAIVVFFVLTIATTLIVLYLNTDLFKSNETLFLKYVGKNAQNIEAVEKVFENTDYNNLLQTNKYTEETEVKVNYTKNLGTTSEDTSNAINKLKLQIKGQTDKSNQYNYKDIKLLNDNNQELEVEYMQNGNDYGIKFSDLFKQYILVENNNLKELLKNAGYTDEELENVPDSIEIGQDALNNIKFSEEELQTLSDKYLNLISQKVSKDQFEKQSKQTITINQQDIIVNSYTLKLTKEQLNNLYVTVLENLKEDEIFLGKIDNIQKIFEPIEILTSDAFNIREKVIDNIEKTINEINNNNIGNEETRIIVYESEGDTVRTTIQGVDYEFNIDYLPIDNEKFAEFTFKEKEEVKKVTIDNKDGETSISLEKNEDNQLTKLDFIQSINMQDNNCVKNTNIKYEDDSNRIETIITQNISIVDNFDEQINIDNENAIKLNTLDSEQMQEILNRVSGALEDKLNSVEQEINIEDIQEILKTMGIIQDKQKLEGNGISEVEKNRFNSKFEILEGEQINNENMLEIIEILKENLINIEVVSNEELKLEISQSDKNEQLAEVLENFVQNDKNRKYNISVEYDEETGLVKYIIMTIFKES